MTFSFFEKNNHLIRIGLYYFFIAFGGCIIGFITCIAAGMELRWFVVYLLAVLLLLIFMVSKQRKRVSLALFVFFLPLFVTKKIYSSEYTMLTGGPSSLSIFLYDIPLMILLFHFVIDRIFRRDISLHVPAVFIPMVMYIIWSGISIINSAEPILTLLEFAWLLRMALILILIVNVIKDRKDLILVVSLLMAGLFIQEIITFIQVYLKTWFTFTGDVAHTVLESTANPGTFRAGGTVGLHNVQASYYVLLLSLATALFFKNRSARLKYALLFVILLGILSIILTYSRNGYISLAVAMAVVTFLAARKKMISIKYLIYSAWFFILIVFLIIPLGGENVINRIKSKAAIKPRMETVEIAFRMIGKYPVLGVGLNNFSIVMVDDDYSPYGISDLQQAYIGGEYFRNVVHNKYLLVASETGIVGLAFFLWMHYIIFSASFKLLKKKDRFFWAIGAGMTGALIGASIQMLFSIYNADILISVFWVLVALTFAAYKVSLNEERAYVHPQ
jgi:O-antigen ligase